VAENQNNKLVKQKNSQTTKFGSSLLPKEILVFFIPLL